MSLSKLRFRFLSLTILTVGLVPPASAAPAEDSTPLPPRVTLQVQDQVVNTVNPLVFGQFLEIASWGELGPEAMVDPDTGDLPPDILELLRQLRAPIIRFPGGIDIDYIDWTDRIDNLPGREGQARPITERNGNSFSNHFGYDEFLRLTETLGSQPLLVVDLRDALEPGADVQAVAQHAAAMVAYCNGETSGDLSPEMRAWAKLRQTNGRTEPWGVEAWQIGNETWGYIEKVAERRGLTDRTKIANWYVDTLTAFAQAMRAVDPEIKLMTDGWLRDRELTELILADPRLREHYEYLTIHKYAPGGTVKMSRHGQPVLGDDITPRDLWYAWVSMPGAEVDEQWLAFNPQHSPVMAMPGDLGVTEWNWNGWGDGMKQLPELSSHAAGLGAAGFLHGMMRQGDRIHLATQSMMLGVNWRLASIHADPDGKHPPFISPTGAATALYSEHHGPERLALQFTSTVPAIHQTLMLTGWGEKPARTSLPMLDVVATRGDNVLYLHVVQRSFSESLKIAVDLSRLTDAAGSAVMHALIARDQQHPGVADADQVHRVQWEAEVNDREVIVDLPARSIAVLRIELD